MTTSIILTVINIVLAWFFYYRIGKQSVINDLIKAYKEVCKDNEEQRIIIKCLQERLKNTRAAPVCHDKDGTS